MIKESYMRWRWFVFFVFSSLLACSDEDKPPLEKTFIKYIATNSLRAGSTFLPSIVELKNSDFAMLSLVEKEENQKSILYFVVSRISPNGELIKEQVLTDLPNALPISQGNFAPLAANLLKYRSGGIQQTESGLVSVIGSVVDTILGNAVSRTFINLFDTKFEQRTEIDLRIPNILAANEGFIGATLVPDNNFTSLYAFSSYNRLNRQTNQFDYDLFFAKTTIAQNPPEIVWNKFFGNELEQELACKIITIPNTADIVWAATVYANGLLRYRLGRLDDKGAIIWSQLIRGLTSGESVSVSDIYYYGNSILVLGCYGSDLGSASRVYLANFDLDGNLNWERFLDVKAESAYGMQISTTLDNRLVISGHLRSRSDDDMDMFLVKINSTGTLIWQRTYKTVGEDFNSGVLALQDGTFLLYGSCFPTATLGLVGLFKTDSEGLLSK